MESKNLKLKWDQETSPKIQCHVIFDIGEGKNEEGDQK